MAACSPAGTSLRPELAQQEHSWLTQIKRELRVRATDTLQTGKDLAKLPGLILI